MDLKKAVYGYPTKYKEGFIQSEIDDLLSGFDNLNMDKWYDAMMGNTCMMIKGKIINYHCDVLTALSCAIEGRDITFMEFD